jgi:hypothetical protein
MALPTESNFFKLYDLPNWFYSLLILATILYGSTLDAGWPLQTTFPPHVEQYGGIRIEALTLSNS